MEEEVKKKLLKEMKTTDLISELWSRKCIAFKLKIHDIKAVAEIKVDLTNIEALSLLRR